jgi:hypothetical protein
MYNKLIVFLFFYSNCSSLFTLEKFFSNFDIYLGPDTFRGIPSGSWSGDSGADIGGNILFGIKENHFIFGGIIGGSYGLYDWDDRGFSAARNQTQLQQQGFVSGAIFLGSDYPYGLDVAISYDLMLNSRFGVFAVNPFVDQVRAKLGLTLNDNDQIGAWVTHFITQSYTEINQVPLTFRAIPQVNAYWSHFFKNSSRISLWAGSPYGDSLMYTFGSAGKYIVGADFKAMLSKNLSFTGTWSYMGSKGYDPFSSSANFGNNIGFAITYSFGEENSRIWMAPANNSNFFVDTNANQ